MGNLSVRSSNQTPVPVPSQNGNETATAEAGATQTATAESGDATSKNSEGNQQHAAQRKSEQNLSGAVRQRELNAQFASGPKHAKKFPASAGNDELGKVNVHRQSTDNGSITRYPNGVKFKDYENIAMYAEDRIDVSSNKVHIQKAKSWNAIEVESPPGAKVTAQKDGSVTFTTSSGKTIATVDKDGNLKNYTKHGEYTQNANGEIKFVQKGKSDLESLRKPGAIDRTDYENYGITVSGDKLQFPNGVEISRKQPDDQLNATNVSMLTQRMKDNQLPLQIQVPENSSSISEITNYGPEFSAWTSDGTILVKADRDGAYIPTNGGRFVMTKEGEVSFEPLNK